MHKNCCKTRYNIKHTCNTNCDNEATIVKTSFKSDKCEPEVIKSKYKDLILFGSILQYELIALVFMALAYIIKDLHWSCVQKPQQSTSCFSSRNYDNSFKSGLETCSCSRYYFNLLLAYLISIQIIAGVLLWRDRERATKQMYRVWPETHWLIAFAGGIPATWICMNILRFKLCVPKYYYTAVLLTFINALWPILYFMYNLNKK
jgi:uncharacterized membrane protein YsdA (DUF1294 family)